MGFDREKIEDLSVLSDVFAEIEGLKVTDDQNAELEKRMIDNSVNSLTVKPYKLPSLRETLKNNTRGEVLIEGQEVLVSTKVERLEVELANVRRLKIKQLREAIISGRFEKVGKGVNLN